jgi:hypothetical protein
MSDQDKKLSSFSVFPASDQLGSGVFAAHPEVEPVVEDPGHRHLRAGDAEVALTALSLSHAKYRGRDELKKLQLGRRRANEEN